MSTAAKIEARWSFREVARATGIDRRVLSTAAKGQGIVEGSGRGRCLDRAAILALAAIFGFTPDFI